MAFGETLADILGGIGRGFVEAIPATVEAGGRGFLAGVNPELAIKLREAEAERLWKQEEQRRREEAAMRQMEERLLRERSLRESMFEKEAGLKRELAGEGREQQLKLARERTRLELGMKFLLEGTEEGRKLGYAMLGPWAPMMQQYFEGKAISPPEAPTVEPPTPPSITAPSLREGAVVTPTPKKRPSTKIPRLIQKDPGKAPAEFAGLVYGMNAIGMSPENQLQVMNGAVKQLIQKKLADPAYQITGKPDKGPGGLIWGNFKNGDYRPLQDADGKVIPFIEVTGSGEQGWWRIDHYRAQQGAKDAYQLVVPPAEASDPLGKRESWLEDAINLKIPSAEVFKFGEQGKAIIPRHWFGSKTIPWGPTGLQTPVEDVIRDLGRQYYLDLKVEYNEKDDAWAVAILSDLAAKYKRLTPGVPEERFKQEPLKPTPQALKEQVWAHSLKAAEGDKVKARELAVEYLKSKGYDPTKIAKTEPERSTKGIPDIPLTGAP